MEKEDVAPTDAFAASLRAGLAELHKDTSKAIALYSKAAKLFDALDMPVIAASQRMRAGLLTPGERGQQLASEAEALMKKCGVKNPGRFSVIYTMPS